MSASIQNHRPDQAESFAGFLPLDANYIYTPNQFFDVCLRHCSRGAVRIVAYLLRQTLGWLDENGNPKQQDIRITYNDLIRRASVSRGAISKALEEVMAAGFVVRNRGGKSSSAGHSAVTASYSLNWHRGGDYTTDPNHFAGFFGGEGHRTPVPNQFFDEIIPLETLSVVRVVGAIIRNTIGYQNQFGGRRRSVPLSYDQILRSTGLSDRSTVNEALKHAIDRGYVVKVEEGTFSHNQDLQRAAVYSVRWLTEGTKSATGSKTRPGGDRFRIQTSTGSENQPAERFKNQTSKEKTQEKDTVKQQQAAAEKSVIQSLIEHGMDKATAEQLVRSRGVDAVRKQLDWLPYRNVRQNAVGLLRKAIEDSWDAPAEIQAKHRREQARKQQEISEAARRRQEQDDEQHRRGREMRKRTLLAEWGRASMEDRVSWIRTAVERANSHTIRMMLRKQSAESDSPPVEVLNALAHDRGLKPVFDYVQKSTDLESKPSSPAVTQNVM